jgi:hypothetical protein
MLMRKVTQSEPIPSSETLVISVVLRAVTMEITAQQDEATCNFIQRVEKKNVSILKAEEIEIASSFLVPKTRPHSTRQRSAHMKYVPSNKTHSQTLIQNNEFACPL